METKYKKEKDRDDYETLCRLAGIYPKRNVMITKPFFNITEKPSKGGFFELPAEKKGCNHPEHRPPMHIHIPQGKGYRHICPLCGNVTDLIPPQITC